MNYLLIYNTKYSIVTNTNDILRIIKPNLNNPKTFSLIISDTLDFDTNKYSIMFEYKVHSKVEISDNIEYKGKIQIYVYKNSVKTHTHIEINTSQLTIGILQKFFDKMKILQSYSSIIPSLLNKPNYFNIKNDYNIVNYSDIIKDFNIVTYSDSVTKYLN